MATTHDVIVVGAGPAGSTAARLLARAGARVAMLDRARFPRDKPCGGGVTFRADTANDLDLAPVTEREIHGVRVSIEMGHRFERRSDRVLARMTQRSRLDAFLAERAVCAGADFRDGSAIREIELDETSVRARVNGDVYEGRVLIGADGTNGISAKLLGLDALSEYAVAFEANVPADARMLDDWSRSIALDLGGIPGGYGWVFPKGDHLNVGVGGWQEVGPTLRARLARLCAFYGFDESRLFGERGYRLPLRRDDASIVRGPAMLAGDAACLVDPLSGEGIWAAFVSGRLAAEEALRYLAGDVRDLGGYQCALDREMREELLASRRLHAILQRLPSFSVLMLKYNPTFWRYMTEIIRGDITYDDLPRKLGPLRRLVEWWGDYEVRRHERHLAKIAVSGRVAG